MQDYKDIFSYGKFSCNLYSLIFFFLPCQINLDILLSDDSTFGDLRETRSCWNILQKLKALSNRESVGCSDRSRNVETSKTEAALWERRAFSLFIISVILKNFTVWEVTAVSDCAYILLCVTVFQTLMIIITKECWLYSFPFVFPVSLKTQKSKNQVFILLQFILLKHTHVMCYEEMHIRK